MSYELRRRRADVIPDSVLFAEMARIWTLLGHRPSRHEWEMAGPSVSYITYRRRFGGWVNACAAFIDSQMATATEPLLSPRSKAARKSAKPDGDDKRDVPLRVRLKVMQRDGFRCVLCGLSPATTPGVVLHLDHVRPYALGGKTTFENLRTLCAACNLGKGKSDVGAA